MDSLSILIKSILQSPTDADINKVKEDLQKKLSNIKINTNTNGKGIKVLDETEITQYQKHMQNMMTNLRTKYGSLLDSGQIKKDVDAFNTALSGFGKNGLSKKDLGLQFETLTTGVRSSSSALRLATQDADSFGNTLAKDFTKFSLWFGIGTIFMSFIHGISDAITYTNQLDNSLNEIRIVTGKNNEEVQKLAKSYNDLAKSMSVSTTDVASTAVDLFRQGLQGTDVEERMQAIIKYAKISSLSLSESNKIITSTMNATGESAQKVIDIFSYLGDATASGADEIGTAMQKVASMNDGIGVSMAKAASWVAVISSKTREGASQIGTSLKSIESRYSSIKSRGFNEEDAVNINDVTKALKVAGIQATTTDGQLKNFAEVIDLLGTRYSSLDKKTQNYVMTTLGGTYQMNRLRALMEGYSQSVDLYNNSLSQTGIANQKFNIWQESTAAKMDKLKASFESFWQSSVDSGLIKGTLDSLTSLVDTFGNLQTIITISATALLLWKGSAIIAALGLKSFSLATNLASSNIKLFNQFGFAMQAQAAGAATTVEALGFSFKALGTSILTSMASNPLGWIAIGLTTIISLVDMYNQKQEEMKQKIQESADKAKEQSDSISNLIGKYNELNSILDKDDNTRQQLKTTQEEIIKLLGLEKGAIDLVNGSYDTNIQKIKEKSLEQLKANQQSLQAAYNLAKDTSQNTQGGASSWVNGDQEYHGSFVLDNKSKEAYNLLQNSNIKGLDIGNQKISSSLKGAEERIKAVQMAIDKLTESGKTDNDVYNQLVISRDNYQKSIDNENSALTELNKNLATQGALQAQMTIGTPDKSNFDAFKNGAVEAIAKQQGLNKVSEDFKKIIYDQIDNMYPSLSGKINQVSDSANQASNSTNKYATALKTATEAYDIQTQKVQSLISIREELNSKEGLSAKTMQEIITKHQELIPYLNDETTLRKKLTELIGQEEKTQKTAYANMLMVSEQFYNAKIKGNVELYNEIKDKYGIDLKNYKSLAEAKMAVESKLLSELAQKWGQFYDADTDSFTVAWEQKKKAMIASGDGARASVYQDQISAYGNKVQDIKNKFQQIALDSSPIDFNKINLGDIKTNKSGSTGTTKTLTALEAEDSLKLIDIIIQSAEKQSKVTAEKNKQIESQIKIAKQQKDYNKELDLTNKLITGQNKQIIDIESAKAKIKAKEDSSSKSSKRNTSTWFNADGGASSDYLSLDEAYIKKANNIIKQMNVYENKSSLTKSEQAKYASLKNQLSANDNERKSVEQLFSSLDKLKKEYTSLIDTQSSLKDSNSSLIQSNIDLAKSQAENNKKDIETLTDLTVKMIKQQKENELNAYKEIIDAKKKSLDLTEQELEYQEELANKNVDISKDQDRLLELQRDTSLSANAEKLTLQDSLNKKLKEKEVTQRKHSVDSQKSALDEDYNNFEKATKDYLNQEGKVLADARTMIDSQSMTLYNSLINWNKTYGTSIDSDITSAWSKATDALKEYKNAKNQIDSNYAINTINNTLNNGNDKASIMSQMRTNSNAYGTASASDKKILSDKNLELGKSIGWTRNSAGYWLDENGKIAQYAEGTDDIKQLSVVGEKGRELRVLNPNGKDSIIPNGLTENLISFAQNPLNFMSTRMPNFTPTSNMNNGGINLSMPISVAGNLDRTVLPDIESIVNKAVTKINNTLVIRGNGRTVESFSQ